LSYGGTSPKRFAKAGRMLNAQIQNDLSIGIRDSVFVSLREFEPLAAPRQTTGAGA
jgi:hypothetical protein